MIRPLFSPEMLMKARTYAFYGSVLGLVLFCRWTSQPVSDDGGPSFGWAILIMIGAGWLLSQDWLERLLGRFNAPTRGEWRTARAARLRLLLPFPCMIVLLIWAGQTGWSLWTMADLPRFVGLVAVTLLLSALAIRNTLQIWRARVELRVSEAGVFAQAWRRTYSWDEIAFAVQPGGPRELRLVLTDAAAQAAGRSALLTAPLAPTGLFPNEALAALRAVQPDLPIEPWTSNGVVLPIRGATDLPDVSKVGTYG
ncbi:hypothetical protein CA606_19115 [Caulobacter vibrioides]|uniref:Uncharacterized protein n=1 Tax=Caulobacter vibrioides TaxID=155892 RepID=A0A290MQB2_CAUVI|nr:hypothetical protein [Caulobacter vibrioides]ATC34277.1 hypothetical protein CA606_19115 [Caulobacter vibrioides]